MYFDMQFVLYNVQYTATVRNVLVYVQYYYTIPMTVQCTVYTFKSNNNIFLSKIQLNCTINMNFWK